MYTRYLVPSHPDILVEALLTVPDAPDGKYAFAGVPDGIGAFALSNSANSFEIVVTHELPFTAGQRRAHANSGAFVSRWTVDTTHWNKLKGKGRLGVMRGRDQIRTVHYWVHKEGVLRISKNVPLERLCSADLPAPSALRYVNPQGVAYGTEERLFLGGEETHTAYGPDHGRAFAHILTGPREGHTYELPHLGRASFENVLLCPYAQRKTIAMLPDDAESHRVYDKNSAVAKPAEYDHYHPPSELYVYVGHKLTEAETKGSEFPLEIAAAGLAGGKLYGVQVMVEGEPVLWEHREFGFGKNHYVGKAEIRLLDLGDRSQRNTTSFAHAKDNPGVALQRESIDKGVTQFLRPEDGAWDPREDHQHEFYFATTDRFAGNSRLFRVTFQSLEKLGDSSKVCGTIEILLNAKVNSPGASPGHRHLFHSLDSVTVDSWGRVLLQEDPGDEEFRTRTLMYSIDSKKLYCVAEGNCELFDRRGSHYLTKNEEAAGIVPVFEVLGEGWYLSAIQANIEENWAKKVLPGLLSYEQQLRLETDLVSPGQLCAIYIPKDIEAKLEPIL